MTAAACSSASAAAWRRTTTLSRRPHPAPLGSPAPTFEAELDECPPRPAFRLVLPRDKRDRLVQRTAALAQRRRCGAPGCQAEGLPVVLVESEREALLCPVHQLVHLDGSPVPGQPMLATAAW